MLFDDGRGNLVTQANNMIKRFRLSGLDDIPWMLNIPV